MSVKDKIQKIKDLTSSLLENKDHFEHFDHAKLNDTVIKLEMLDADVKHSIDKKLRKLEQERYFEEEKKKYLEPIHYKDDLETRKLKLQSQLENSRRDLRDKYIKECGGWVTDFDYRYNCIDHCRGWNGVDKSCECKCNQVGWDTGLCYMAI
jgi:protein associated with RNAse G/E